VREARAAIGELELNSLKDGRPVAFSKWPTPIQSEVDAHDQLVGWLKLVTIFLHHTWFLKDNAAGLELGYVIWPTRSGICTLRNFLGLVITNAALTQDTQSFTTHEFRQARELFQQDFIASALSKIAPVKVTRLERAKYFVQAARVAEHLPVKIANYCTSLEALFSNDASELTYKLSERVGWFIGRDAGERIDIFHRVKKAYGIRSKVVHGATDWGKDVVAARETSEFLDRTLRRVFEAVRADPRLRGMFSEDSESGKKKHEEFFSTLTMGRMPESMQTG
jgi:hypothetical protein